MGSVQIHIEGDALGSARGHLLPRGGVCEEAVFLFHHSEQRGDDLVLRVVEAMPIAPGGFAIRSRYHLELGDATRAQIIKRAHDLGAGLIECHSHPGQREACFSWSDLHGFDEFVPHVMWRLKGRPYAAIVFASDSIDAVCWRNPGSDPEPIAGLFTESGVVRPTGLTLADWSEIYD